MSIRTFIELKDKFELQEYVRPMEADKKECVSFYGSPRKHPNENSRVILVVDPLSENTFYYEFNIDDIVLAEEQPSISNLEGESVSMVRLWLRKKSIALRCTPFVVDAVTRI